MGYRPPPTNFRMMWGEDHRLHGLEVYARGLKLGAMLDLAKMYVESGIAGKEDSDDLTAEDIQVMLAMFGLLVGSEATVDEPARRGLILSWNREDEDGNPLPVSMTGLRELELWEFQEIMSAYLEHGGAKLEDPLSGGSKSGEPSQALDELTALSSLDHQN